MGKHNIPDEFVIEISRTSGLSFKTVKELLLKGWTHRQNFGEPSVWLDPSYQIGKVVCPDVSVSNDERSEDEGAGRALSS